MKNITKKIIISSIVGLMQIGLGSSVLEALPLNNPPPVQQADQDQDRKEAERIENERHEHAMERRPNESDREWEERQRRENQRHEKNLWLIGRAILM